MIRTLEARWRALGAGEALFHALGAGDLNEVRRLLPLSDVRLAPLLEHAADCGQPEMVRWLVSAEAATLLPPPTAVPVVSRHRHLSDLIHAHAAVRRLTASSEDQSLLEAVERLTLDEVRTSVSLDPQLRDDRNWLGHTLLHTAAASGEPAAVALLLECGFDPAAADLQGHQPLGSIANRIPGLHDRSVAIAALLVDAGADVNARSGVESQTALHMAARRGNVALGRFLLQRGADPTARTRKGDTPLDRARKCRQRAFVELLA